ncbi:hypothetical protein [Pontibacter liquoris]|nr:hypothetical protein [Pontibacter liquoris]
MRLGVRCLAKQGAKFSLASTNPATGKIVLKYSHRNDPKES